MPVYGLWQSIVTYFTVFHALDSNKNYSPYGISFKCQIRPYDYYNMDCFLLWPVVYEYKYAVIQKYIDLSTQANKTCVDMYIMHHDIVGNEGGLPNRNVIMLHSE